MVSFSQSGRLIFILIPLALGFAVLIRHRRRLSQQKRLASPAVWERLVGGSPSTGLWRMILWCGAAALIIVALAGPQWGEEEREVSIRTRDLVFALDLSKSMQCPDVEDNRLNRALSVIRHSLPGLDGNRVGIVIFAGAAYPLVPLTTDLEAVASFLDGVDPDMVSEPGSNLQAAAEAAVKLLPKEGEGRVLVLFSDGENLQGDPDSAQKTLKDAGVSFIGVLVGTPEGGPIPTRDSTGAVHYKRDRQGQTVVTHADPSTLKQMAEALGGKVISANRGEPEKKLIETVEALRTRESERKRRPRKIDRFPIFLSGAALLLGISFLLSPWRKKAAAIGVALFFLIPNLDARRQTPPGAMSLPGVHAPPPSGPAPGPPGQAPAQQSAKTSPPPAPELSWWQRVIPGGVRRLARSGLAAWEKGNQEKAAEKFGAATLLKPEDSGRLYDYGTALAATGHPEAALPILEKAGTTPGADYNAGTAALGAQKADVALRHLKKALLADPGDPDIKRNYELALRLLEQQKKQQQKDQKKDQKDQKEKDKKEQEKKKQEQKKQEKKQEQKQQGAKPTPTPAAGGQPHATPTPNPKEGLYSALRQSEADARKEMRTPTPAKASAVEKDW